MAKLRCFLLLIPPKAEKQTKMTQTHTRSTQWEQEWECPSASKSESVYAQCCFNQLIKNWQSYQMFSWSIIQCLLLFFASPSLCISLSLSLYLACFVFFVQVAIAIQMNHVTCCCALTPHRTAQRNISVGIPILWCDVMRGCDCRWNSICISTDSHKIISSPFSICLISNVVLFVCASLFVACVASWFSAFSIHSYMCVQ